MSNYIIKEATLTSLADNIRRIKNLSNTMSAEDMNTYLDAIKTRTSSDLTVSDAMVTAPAGYYAEDADVSVSIASRYYPSVSIDASSGLVTASTKYEKGYVADESTLESTLQLTTQAAKTVTPTTSEQTAVASGVYTTGAVTVAAIPSNYIDTSSADATAVDIVTDKTAYVNGSKITGTNPYVKSTTDAEVTTQAGLITDLQTVLAGKVGGGSSDTADATAQPTDIAEGKTAYARGAKITGTVPEVDWFEEYSDSVTYSDGRITLEGMQHAAAGPQRQIVNYGARIDAAASDFGDATAADVMSGKTFTSSAGLTVTGTGNILETEPAPAYEFVLVYNDRESYGWGFTKSTTDGYTDYYESENAGESSSAAYCDCYFNVWTVCDVTFSVMNSGESTFDYGVVGPLDTAISSDNSNAAFNFSGTIHSAPVNITFSNVSVGQHRVQFKYQKDSGVNSNSDCFRFKLNTAPNTAAVLTDASKELVRSMEHNAKSYYIMSGVEILGVTGTYDNSIKNCTITTSGFTGYSYWTKANYSSLIMQMMTTASSSYTMSNVACGSVFVIYAPGYYFVDSEYFEYSDELTLITTGDGWAVFAAPDTANYSGIITWTGGTG